MGRRNWNAASASAFSGASSAYTTTDSHRQSVSASLNSEYSSLAEEVEDKTGRPIKKQSCWQRWCCCLNRCCCCVPAWGQCLMLTTVVLAALFLIIYLILDPITTFLINDSDPRKIQFEGLALSFPVIPISFNLTFNAKLLDPSPISANVDATNLHLSLIRRDGQLEYLADVWMPAFHITPGQNTTIKIPVFSAKVMSLTTLVNALGDAIIDGNVRFNTKANLTVHVPIWPLPINAKMDKNLMPVSTLNLITGLPIL